MLCPDIMGLRPLFDTMAERLAAENGWVVCARAFPGHEAMPLDGAPRLGRATSTTTPCWPTLARPPTPPALRRRSGILGFCMGGMYTFKASATGRFHRAVSFYGMIRMPEQWRSATQAEPSTS